MALQIKEISEIYQALQEDMTEVLREHALQQVAQRITEAERRVKRWEAKYGYDYHTFAERTATDEAYIAQVERHPDSQDWEGDLFEWEIDVLELARWQSHLQKLSNEMDCQAFLNWLKQQR